MKQLQVSDEQYAFIQELREAMAADVVGEYGFVRERDAVRFLIDNLDADIDVDPEPALEHSAIEDTAASVAAAIEGNPDTHSPGTEVSYDEDEASSPEPTEEEAEDEETAESEPDEGEGGPADDDEMLNEMMNLLETHDDKWEESSSADYRYSVELPDGTTDDVQTKDDVRALLFQHYR